MAGENIGWTAGYSNATAAIQVILNAWWEEYRLASAYDIENFKSS